MHIDLPSFIPESNTRLDHLNIELFRYILRLVGENNSSELATVRNVCKEWQSSCQSVIQTLVPSRLDENIPRAFPNVRNLHLDFKKGVKIPADAERIFKAMKQLRVLVIQSVNNEHLQNLIPQIQFIDLDQVTISYPSPYKEISLNPHVAPMGMSERK